MAAATQNELNGDDAAALIRNGVIAVARGEHALLTRSRAPVRQLKHSLGPAKAANAGGVATSVLEMQQNA